MLQRSVIITLLVLLPWTLCHITIQVKLNKDESPIVNYYGESKAPVNSDDLDRFLVSNDTLLQSLKDRFHEDKKTYTREIATITKPVNAFVDSVDVTHFKYQGLASMDDIDTEVFPSSYRITLNTVLSTWLNNEKENKRKKIFYMFHYPGTKSLKTHSGAFGADFKLMSIYDRTDIDHAHKTELNDVLCTVKLVVNYEVELASHYMYLPYYLEADRKWHDYLITGVDDAPPKYLATQTFTIYYHWSASVETAVKPLTKSE